MIYINEIEPLFGVEAFEIIAPNYNVAPTQIMPVIRRLNGKRQLEMMRWGIPRIIGKDLVKDIINTRADKAFSGFWKKQVTSQRVLVPASSFFEWKTTASGKLPYVIKPTDENVFAFAGIWNSWTDKNNNTFHAYSIMTTDPNAEMKQIHDRMPVILHENEYDDWLHDELDQARIAELLLPSEDGRLEIHQVSTAVNNVRNNSEELLNPVE